MVPVNHPAQRLKELEALHHTATVHGAHTVAASIMKDIEEHKAKTAMPLESSVSKMSNVIGKTESGKDIYDLSPSLLLAHIKAVREPENKTNSQATYAAAVDHVKGHDFPKESRVNDHIEAATAHLKQKNEANKLPVHTEAERIMRDAKLAAHDNAADMHLYMGSHAGKSPVEWAGGVEKDYPKDPHVENLKKLATAKKGRGERKQHTEVGPKGGKFYITTGGHKVYAKGSK
jgi:hypothetical protein